MRGTLTLGERANQELRQALSQITPTTADDQISHIEALRLTHNHSIALVPWSGALSFNCVQYAFDLIDLLDVIRCKINSLHNEGQRRRIGPLGTSFVNFLIKENDLQGLTLAESGSVIVYLTDNGKVQHCGKMLGGKLVRSKWGYQGCVWQHHINEVPITYGAPRFFMSVSTNNLVPQLLSFMKEICDADTPRKHNRLLKSLSAAAYFRGV